MKQFYDHIISNFTLNKNNWHKSDTLKEVEKCLLFSLQKLTSDEIDPLIFKKEDDKQNPEDTIRQNALTNIFIYLTSDCHAIKHMDPEYLVNTMGLKSPDFANLIYGGISNSIAEQERKCNMHSALVLGKRCHKGNLQLLIKNSCGKTCSFYGDNDDDFVCEEDTGYFWISEDILIDNTNVFNILK